MVEISEEELAALRAQAAGEPVSQNPLINRGPKTNMPPEEAAEILAALKYALTGWGGNVHEPFDIVCPSGQVCQARQITIEDAISLGMLDSLDMFTNNLMTPIIEGTEEGEEPDANKAILEGLKDPEKRANFFGTVNRVVGHAVLQPSIVFVTKEDGSVGEGEVFADDIPFQDKMHIFRRVFAGGGPTLDRFQQGQESVVADVASVSGVQVPSE